MSTDERAIHLDTARRMILDWLVFSTLRHYAVACQAVRVRDDGTTTVTLQLEVPGPELHAALWKETWWADPRRGWHARTPTEKEPHERA